MGSAGPRSPVRVGNLLEAALPGLGQRMLAGRIRAEWAEIVGAELARRARPERLERGTLTVTADGSPCLQELTLRSDALLRSLRLRYGTAVTSLRFVPGSGGGTREDA